MEENAGATIPSLFVLRLRNTKLVLALRAKDEALRKERCEKLRAEGQRLMETRRRGGYHEFAPGHAQWTAYMSFVALILAANVFTMGTGGLSRAQLNSVGSDFQSL